MLRHDPDPAIYVYHQRLTMKGGPGLAAASWRRVRLERFGEGTIYPHEETHAAAKADRLKLTQACRANLSQIFGLYPDPDNAVQEIARGGNRRDLTAWRRRTIWSVEHRMWPVTDVKIIAEVAGLMGPRPIFIADGHHRYETACTYRDQLASSVRPLPADASPVRPDDVREHERPGHGRVADASAVSGLPAIGSEQLVDRLGDCFTYRTGRAGPAAVESVWQMIEGEGDQGTLGLYASADQPMDLGPHHGPGSRRMAQLAPDHCSDWRELGVAILHRLVVDRLLGARDLPKPEYVHRTEEVRDGLEQGDEDGQPYPLAALVMPATLEHIQAVSQQAERMPAKSTYFYPKLLSGLVIHPLD